MSSNSPPSEGSEACSKGKQAFSSYGEALYGEALFRLQAIEAERSKGGWQGSVYTCESCGRFHITGRQFTIWRKKGRGKSRRGLAGGPFG